LLTQQMENTGSSLLVQRTLDGFFSYSYFGATDKTGVYPHDPEFLLFYLPRGFSLSDSFRSPSPLNRHRLFGFFGPNRNKLPSSNRYSFLPSFLSPSIVFCSTHPPPKPFVPYKELFFSFFWPTTYGFLLFSSQNPFSSLKSLVGEALFHVELFNRTAPVQFS